MRNSKKFKFLGKFFSAKNLDRIDQLAGRIPARGLTVRPTRNQRGFPRQPAVDLPLAENARNVPSDDFEQRMPTHPSPPRQTSACRCRGSPRPENAPRRRFVRFHSPLSHQPRPRPCARPSTIVTSTPRRSAGPSLHGQAREGHSHRGFIKHRVIPTSRNRCTIVETPLAHARGYQKSKKGRRCFRWVNKSSRF